MALVGVGVVMAAAMPAPAAPPANPLSGFCLFARGTAIRQSRAGNAAWQQMNRLEEGIAANLRRQRDLLDMEDRTLAGQRATLSAPVFEARLAELKGRLAALDQATARGADQAARTRAAAQQRIDAVLDPLLNMLFAERGCIVLMERNNAYIYANQLDLTAATVARLDAALPAFTLTLMPPR